MVKACGALLQDRLNHWNSDAGIPCLWHVLRRHVKPSTVQSSPDSLAKEGPFAGLLRVGMPMSCRLWALRVLLLSTMMLLKTSCYTIIITMNYPPDCLPLTVQPSHVLTALRSFNEAPLLVVLLFVASTAPFGCHLWVYRTCSFRVS